MFAIVGGSGFEKFDGFEVLQELPRETPFGLASSGFKKVKVAGVETLFLSRHGSHHELMPSEINFRANIFAIKAAGARAIISVSAVGSLREELPPGSLMIPLQYIDRTKGTRRHTFCGDGIVAHTSLAHPVSEPMARRAEELAKKCGLEAHIGGTYVCIEGPNFSTRAESLFYRDMPADIIGMTNVPEFSLAREAGLSYLPLSFITDYDCWDTSRPHVTLEDVIQIMRQNNAKAFQLLKEIVTREAQILEGVTCAGQGLRAGLMTPKDAIAPDKRKWLDVLLN